MSNVIFTAVFGWPDALYEPPDTKWDKICYTDLEFRGESRYSIVPVELDELIPRKRQRYVKIFWPGILDNYEYSFYLDSNVLLKADPEIFIDFLQPGSDILVYRHPGRDCLYDEASLCVAPDIRMVDPEIVKKQLDKYEHEGYPRENGLFACTVMLRRHTQEMKDFCKDWWEEVRQFTQRDQISFPYIVWKHDLKVSTFPRGTLYNNEWFELMKHDAKSSPFIQR